MSGHHWHRAIKIPQQIVFGQLNQPGQVSGLLKTQQLPIMVEHKYFVSKQAHHWEIIPLRAFQFFSKYEFQNKTFNMQIDRLDIFCSL